MRNCFSSCGHGPRQRNRHTHDRAYATHRELLVYGIEGGGVSWGGEREGEENAPSLSLWKFLRKTRSFSLFLRKMFSI